MLCHRQAYIQNNAEIRFLAARSRTDRIVLKVRLFILCLLNKNICVFVIVYGYFSLSIIMNK